MDSKFIINLFGTGIRYWICEIPIPLFEEMNKIRLNHKVEWENLLFDFDFLKHFGFNHWSEMSPHPEMTGFLIDHQNRIEIKQGAKFITRFRSNELNNMETLFPLYHSDVRPIENNKDNASFQQIILIHFEKGLIGKFKIETENLAISKFHFQLQFIDQINFLSELQYNSLTLKNTTNDTVVFGSKVVIQGY